MSKRRIVFVAGLLAGLAGIVLILGAAADSSVWLPGITSKDDTPNGCVDCHKALGKEDDRLPVLLGKIKDHPDVTRIVKKVPTDCMICHKAGSKVAPLNIFLHKVHYANPAGNAFVTTNKGSCLNCHSLDAASGEMKIKSGPSNW